MSSPIAHTSLILLFWPEAKAKLRKVTSRRRRILFGMAILAALMGPDFDLIGYFFIDAPLSTYHNCATHSLVGVLAGGVLFTIVSRMIVPVRFGTLFAIGTLAFASHILIDFLTYGRGLLLLWPFSDQRIEAPFIIFRGVRHSSDVTLGTHLLNLFVDILFAVAVWISSGWLRPRKTSN